MLKKEMVKIPGVRFIGNYFRKVIHRILFVIICLIKRVDGKKVIFESFNGKTYSCNPRAISEKLHEQMPEYKIMWIFRNPDDKRNEIPKYITAVKKHSLRSLYERYTSKYWIDNFQLPRHTLKRKKQKYIQTWHGDRAFKKILYDSPNNIDKTKYVENKYCDVMTTGSTFGETLLKSAFQYNGKFLKHGSPRNDCLLKENTIYVNKIKSSLGISKCSKIVLFAPTYRENLIKERQEIPNINLSEVIQRLNRKYNDKWICLIRSHSKVEALTFNNGHPKNVIDVSKYEDMAEILLISDMLITDYSSSAGDFILKEKPVILFQSDREEYIKHDRSFYIPIEETPFFVANNQADIINLINTLDEGTIKRNCNDIKYFYGFYETGLASEEVVKYIQSNNN